MQKHKPCYTFVKIKIKSIFFFFKYFTPKQFGPKSCFTYNHFYVQRITWRIRFC
jgi:hypothetical protein